MGVASSHRRRHVFTARHTVDALATSELAERLRLDTAAEHVRSMFHFGPEAPGALLAHLPWGH